MAAVDAPRSRIFVPAFGGWDRPAPDSGAMQTYSGVFQKLRVRRMDRQQEAKLRVEASGKAAAGAVTSARSKSGRKINPAGSPARTQEQGSTEAYIVARPFSHNGPHPSSAPDASAVHDPPSTSDSADYYVSPAMSVAESRELFADPEASATALGRDDITADVISGADHVAGGVEVAKEKKKMDLAESGKKGLATAGKMAKRAAYHTFTAMGQMGQFMGGMSMFPFPTPAFVGGTPRCTACGRLL